MEWLEQIANSRRRYFPYDRTGTNGTPGTVLILNGQADHSSMNRMLSNLIYKLPIVGRYERERRRQKLLRDLSFSLGVTF